MLKITEKQRQRAAKFARIRAELAPSGFFDHHDARFENQQFEMKRYDAGNRDSEDVLNKDKRSRPEVPLGPRFVTPQWEGCS